MKIDIKVPAAGESVTEADIATWLKASGDMVELDEPIVEFETDKASLEFPAEAAGKLTILVDEGTTVEVGHVIGYIDTDAASETAKPAEEKPSAPKAAASKDAGKRIDIAVPAAGESVTEADIAAWLKSSGEFVEMDEPVIEFETDKASLEFPAPAAGTLTILVESGTVNVGDIVGYVTTGGEAVPEAPSASAPKAAAAEMSSSSNYATGHPSPAAAKMMNENNISMDRGTGKDGRVTKTDVLNEMNKPKSDAPKTEAPAKAAPPAPLAMAPVASGERTVRREKMSRMRKTISSRLVEAQQSAALLTTFNEVDMSAVMDIRKKYKEKFKEKHNVGLGFMSFFTKAAAIALQEHPILNAQVEENDILYHDFADIGIAVSTPKGLVVPVVRDAQALSFSQIEKSILNFALRGRDGVLTPDEMTGGTFTITNGGTFGSMLSTPIVNRPQSAILGMHNIVERPMAVNGQVEIRPIMYLAVTYDHRIIDGSDAVRFLVKIKELIEDPTRLLLDV
jgi:2-oxoglutarate dehydrogenase E2 component (dihydrolipoamide succinyltransferase)